MLGGRIERGGLYTYLPIGFKIIINDLGALQDIQ